MKHSLIMALSLVFTLTACTEPAQVDTFPKIEPSEDYVLAYFTSDVRLTDEGTTSALMVMGSKCKLMVNIQRQGTYIAHISPQSVLCADIRTRTELQPGTMSDAYVDTRQMNIELQDQVRFELYDPEFFNSL
ncbi:MAG: hypothetical protein CL840_03350 [Crocinitomicaceae bacterium]|jgi:hypothetical protein|nr:hypothetical protein [Crocinitomicaceae bacterium]|tara:strand:+ start:154 stop:549 length:396 start_codon:yes stop_codon:yes gene_type:complete